MIRIHQKPLTWLGDSLDVVKEFVEESKKEVGHQLARVQQGHDPVD